MEVATGCFSAWLASDCETHYFQTLDGAKAYVLRAFLKKLDEAHACEFEYSIEFHPFEEELPDAATE